jgi:DNA-binding transcriptional MerR regulator
MAPEKEKELMTTGKAAEKAGVSRQTLQYYLMVGLLEPTEVTKTGRKKFDSEAVKKIVIIKNMNKSGYPLREIRDIFFESDDDLKGSKSG